MTGPNVIGINMKRLEYIAVLWSQLVIFGTTPAIVPSAQAPKGDSARPQGDLVKSEVSRGSFAAPAGRRMAADG